MNSKHGQTRERDQERRQRFFEQEDQEARGRKKSGSGIEKTARKLLKWAPTLG